MLLRLWLHRAVYIGADLICTLGAILAVVHSGVIPSISRLEILATLALSLATYALSGYYNRPQAKSRLSDFTASLCSSLLLASVASWMWGYDLSRLLLALFLCLYLGRSLCTYVLLRLSYRSRYRRRILLLSQGAVGEDLAQWLEGEGRMSIARRVELPLEMEQIDGVLAQLTEATSYADEIVVATTECSLSHISRLLYGLYPLRLPIKLSPRSIPYAGVKLRVQTLVGEPLADLTTSNLSESSRNVKWLADKVLSTLGLLFLSPLMLYIIYRVRKDTPGPAIYQQERIGQHGRPFVMYKFRSMHLSAEDDGPRLSQRGDRRITPWGRTMRRYRLDELPQLWNVLRGDMSLVGPRPERAHYIRQLMATSPQICLLHSIRPGITSWGMVRYGYASTLEEMQERLAYDWLYYENMSLRLDAVVLFYTIQTIFKGLGK